MRHRRWIFVFAIAAVTVPAGAQTFNVASHNTLHFGWGNTNPNNPAYNPGPKVFAILSVLAGQGLVAPAAGAPPTIPNGVLMLQEVMANANTGLLMAGAAPYGCAAGTCQVQTTTPAQRGWYRETYTFFISNVTQIFNAGPAILPCAGPTCPGFARPPAALQLGTANAAYTFVNFHAIWGQSQQQRLNEAAAMGHFLANTYVQAGAVVIAGGDWNLPAPTVAAQLGVAPNCIQPAVLTTVTPTFQLSSSYDHFLFMNGLNCVPNLAITVYPSVPPYQNWRNVVSDHIGIMFPGLR